MFFFWRHLRSRKPNQHRENLELLTSFWRDPIAFMQRWHAQEQEKQAKKRAAMRKLRRTVRRLAHLADLSTPPK